MGKTYSATEKLVYENAIIQGNAPSFIVDNFGSGQEVDYTPSDIHKFGLFETSSPNYNNFYPDVTEEDLKPKDGDYIYPTYRALSEIIVRPRTPVDFSQGNVLKNAMNLLLGQAVYPNHEMIAGDELGVVYGVNWSKAKELKLENGETVKIPAGINAILKIDGKSNPRIARSINMNPPAMHSVSVTVEFEWQKSHEELSDEEFYQKLGTYDEKGQLIRRVVTKINKFYEISLVPHGADPFAKKVDENGNIVLPQFAKASYKFYDSLSEDSPYFTTVSEGSTGIKTTISNSASTPSEINNADVKQLNKENMMKKQLDSLSQVLGHEVTEENFSEALNSFKEIKTKADSVDSLQNEKDSLTSEVENLKTQLLEKQSEVEKYQENLRAEVLKFANLALENKVPEATQNLIAKADLETSKALLAQYQEICKEKYKSSVVDDEGKKQEEGEKHQTLSNEDAVNQVVEEFNKIDTKSIHC